MGAALYALVTLAAVALGLVTGIRIKTLQYRAKELVTSQTCTCKHGRHAHGNQGRGHCHERVARGGPSLFYERCACQHYVGPVPYTELYAIPTLALPPAPKL